MLIVVVFELSHCLLGTRTRNSLRPLVTPGMRRSFFLWWGVDLNGRHEIEIIMPGVGHSTKRGGDRGRKQGKGTMLIMYHGARTARESHVGRLGVHIEGLSTSGQQSAAVRSLPRFPNSEAAGSSLITALLSFPQLCKAESNPHPESGERSVHPQPDATFYSHLPPSIRPRPSTPAQILQSPRTTSGLAGAPLWMARA
jgi:hypothetical protein